MARRHETWRATSTGHWTSGEDAIDGEILDQLTDYMACSGRDHRGFQFDGTALPDYQVKLMLYGSISGFKDKRSGTRRGRSHP